MNRSILTCGWKLHGTNTYRLSSAQLLGEWGGNCQNPDNRLMRHVMPRPGNIFLQCDQAGAEAVIMAYLARPGLMRSLIENRIKPHTYLAMHLFPDMFLPLAIRDRFWMKDAATLLLQPEWKSLDKRIRKESDREYALGKLTCHAKNYDTKYRTFMITVLERTDGEIILTSQEAIQFLEMFDNLFPEILELQDEIRGMVSATRMLRNLFNHPKRFVQPMRSTYERQFLAYIAQSTVGELTVIASNEIRHYLHKHHLSNTILLVNNKHDSLLLDCPTEHRDLGIHLLRHHMSREFDTPRGESFRMGVEVSQGLNWAKATKTNPEGMKEI